MRTYSFLFQSQKDLLTAIETANLDDSSATLVQLFTASANPQQLRELQQRLQHLLPCCRIVGASSRGLIHKGQIVERGILVVLSQFERSELMLTYEAFPGDSCQNWAALGERLGANVIEEDTRLLLCFAYGDLIDAEALVQGIVAGREGVNLSGSLACANMSEDPFIIANEAIFPAGVVLLSINSSGLDLFNYHCQDWMMLGSPMTVTSASGNQVKCINKQPALEVYHKYIGEADTEDMATALLRFPLLMQHQDRTVARLASAIEADGAVRFFGSVAEGETVRFGLLNPVSTLEQLQSIEQALREAPVEQIMVFSSEARKRIMRSVTVDELAKLQALAQVDGAFTTGQLFHCGDDSDGLHYSQTVLGISEGQASPRVVDQSHEHDRYSPETVQLRAMMHLISTTAKELESANVQLEAMVNTDSLTGANNRHRATQVLAQEISRMQRYQRPLSLILLDIDDFKNVNDRFGHQQGDQVLKALTSVSSQLVRVTDLFARWGGEEFMVICPETPIAGAQDLAERLRIAISEKVSAGNEPVTVSIGVMLLHQKDTIESAYSLVDEALYQSKRDGKNRVTVAPFNER